MTRADALDIVKHYAYRGADCDHATLRKLDAALDVLREGIGQLEALPGLVERMVDEVPSEALARLGGLPDGLTEELARRSRAIRETLERVRPPTGVVPTLEVMAEQVAAEVVRLRAKVLELRGPPRPRVLPSEAIAQLHARVGNALDGLDPEAILRERAEERAEEDAIVERANQIEARRAEEVSTANGCLSCSRWFGTSWCCKNEKDPGTG